MFRLCKGIVGTRLGRKGTSRTAAPRDQGPGVCPASACEQAPVEVTRKFFTFLREARKERNHDHTVKFHGLHGCDTVASTDHDQA